MIDWVLAAVAAFAAISAGVAFSVKQAQEAERVDTLLSTTLRNVGIESQEAADRLKTLASQIQKTSTFGDEDLMPTLDEYEKLFDRNLQDSNPSIVEEEKIKEQKNE